MKQKGFHDIWCLKAKQADYIYENYKAYNDGIDDFDFKKAVEAEKKKYFENIKARWNLGESN